MEHRHKVNIDAILRVFTRYALLNTNIRNITEKLNEKNKAKYNL